MSTTKNVSNLNFNILKRKETKVVAPRNPKLLKTTECVRVKVSVEICYEIKVINSKQHYLYFKSLILI